MRFSTVTCIYVVLMALIIIGIPSSVETRTRHTTCKLQMFEVTSLYSSVEHYAVERVGAIVGVRVATFAPVELGFDSLPVLF